VRLSALAASDSGSYFHSTFERRGTHMTALRFDIGTTKTAPCGAAHSVVLVRSELAS